LGELSILISRAVKRGRGRGRGRGEGIFSLFADGRGGIFATVLTVKYIYTHDVLFVCERLSDFIQEYFSVGCSE
jgi:hypothetical protein